eukprot:CAMPEP_0118687574 /NCGR_PEP_ID=MMETSP0800-20121206/8458_1 /TAXON_ID=210618 ORGANISM="Striatella unipunctata, Strain CCMP2910" /NCGR_SAMPLE_ID=MMETSP0800 /ASSEMBLY_ACC=CAM_ASM_000638 /LENGTH=758 /DNA_ID=CAMNT_0006584773 /DNA_START=159 /DNA_END=2438 /DNA_ORIENTATION=+
MLANILEMQQQQQFFSGAVLTICRYTLQQQPLLASVASLVAQGESILHSSSKQNGDDDDVVMMDAQDDDDDDDDDDYLVHAPQSSLSLPNQQQQQRNSSRYTRQDLQTVPKINELYQQQQSKRKKEVVAQLQTMPDRHELVALAKRIARPEGFVQIEPDTIGLLSMLINTNLQQHRTQPLLSSLAFSTRMEDLWNFYLQHNDHHALILFCDLFSHHLLAVDDDTFLQNYNSNGVISAERIVLELKQILHELYWVKPVLSRDLNDPRMRLFLTGTKLWNSLYERWCRLVRSTNSFAQEFMWWFPRLIASVSDEHGAIIQDGIGDDEDDENLADSFKDPKMARILSCIPQAVPFDRRVNLFTSLLRADKLNTQNQRSVLEQLLTANSDNNTNHAQVHIRRDQLYADSKDQLNKLGSRLRHKVQVTFINQHGAQEAGIDGGGVFKEFLDDLIKQAFDPQQKSLFSVTPLQTLAINTSLPLSAENNDHYEFLGRVLGKALYESILVEPQLSLPFLNQLLGKLNTLDDLKNIDPEFHRHLAGLRNMDATSLSNLGLYFDVTTKQLNPQTKKLETIVTELFPGGSDVPVKKDNAIRYVHTMAHHRLNTLGYSQTKAFLRGFRDLIPASWVRLFSSWELQKLISGDDSIKGIDVAGLKRHMQYSGGYHPSQQLIHWFWEILQDDFSPLEQTQFLKFVTSCSRQPLLGFSALAPAPCIQQVRNAADRLPTSSTCMNLLKLPCYESKNQLKEKLLYAISAGAGFELS